jgi:ATP-binding cassette subfamily B protein
MTETSAATDQPKSSPPPRLGIAPGRGPASPTPKLSTNRERALYLLGDSKRAVVVLAISSVLAAIAEAGILAITAQCATSLVNGTGRVHESLGPLNVNTTIRDYLFVALVLALIRLLLQGAISYYPGVITAAVQGAMRRRLLHVYTVASWEIQSQDREGHFQELMTNQIQQASAGAIQSTTLITSFCTFMVLALSAFALNVIAAVTVFAAAIALLAALRPFNKMGHRLAKRLSRAQLDYAEAIGETNRVTEEVTVFGVGEIQETRVDRFITTACALIMRVNLVSRLVPNVYQSMIYFILVIGLLAVDLAHVTGFSSLGAVVLLLVRAGSYGQQVQSSWVILQQALPYVERIQQTSENYEESASQIGHLRLDRIRTIGFDSVTYGYTATRPVLKQLSFSVSAGETVGVIGPSGAGKSTLVQILLGLRAPQTGRYVINGDVAEHLLDEDWHRKVAYVPQQPRLVHATVAENVRFFRHDISDEAVEHACRMARIHDDIATWADTYDTIIGPRADAVSGGQQQRICLARALVAQPEMIILDEPTSALDPRSEALIQESLMALQRDLTLFIIAHRMSTLTICDRVMVVLDGRLDAFDRVDELERSNAYYQSVSPTAVGRGFGLPAIIDENRAV